MALCLSLVVAACASEPTVATPGFGESEPDAGPHRFIDVAAEVGLDFRHGAFNWEAAADPVAMMGGGLCWIDYDRDGWMDLYVVNSYTEAEWGRWQDAGGLPRNALFHNDGGTFTDVSDGSGADLEMRGNGCVAADLDGDGWTDLYVTSARFNALLWNNGDGTFADGAELAGVDAYQWQAAAGAGDLNGDGQLDLVVSGYVDLNNRVESATQGFPNTQFPIPDLLFLNEGSGTEARPTFREVGMEAGLNAHGDEYGLGLVLTDLDRDGDLDVYVANDTQPNRLYLSEPSSTGLGFRLSERSDAGADDPNAGMGVASGDVDGDGRFDLFVTTHQGQIHAAYRNLSDAAGPAFESLMPEFGVADFGMAYTGWGTNWVDFDSDGDLDLFLTYGHVPVLDLVADREPIQAFLNTGGDPVMFEDATEVLGFDQIPEQIWRGSAAADFDNDGDVDLAVVPIGDSLVLLENTAPPGDWLVVVADPVEAGTVAAVESDSGTQEREAIAGSSWLSTDDPRFVFGLGETTTEVAVTVTWPDGSSATVTANPNAAIVVSKEVS